MTSGSPTIELTNAAIAFGERTVWKDLNLTVQPGEFIAVLGPNGSGKTTLLRLLLGQIAPSHGKVLVSGKQPRRGSSAIGYVPQQKAFDTRSSIRSRDLVRMGIDGNRWGVGWFHRSARAQVDGILAKVGASAYANAPVSMLSGGEQQRLRIAQALVTQPTVLLCDEPLLSLDLHHQREVTELIHSIRKAENCSVIFVTHEINPILPYVDRVVYFARGRAQVGTVDEMLRSEVLSELYGSPVEVLRHEDRILVFNDSDSTHHGMEI